MHFSKAFTGLLSFASCVGLSLASFTNPIRNPGGSDPQMTYSGGYYYLLTTTWTDVEIARAKTVAGLKTATKKVVYSSKDATRSCNIWAPEAHYLDGSWYIYFTAGECKDLVGQRLHVLKGGASPWDAYTYAGKLIDEWAIDGSVLRFTNWGNFLMFSCQHNGAHQSICMKKLAAGNTALTGDLYIISSPTESWETHNTPVNEAPAALYFNGKTYISYAASYCWTQYYCMGLLTWDGKTDPRQASAWKKSNDCVFKSANGNYGPASNGFFQSPDAKETWLVYHATSISTGACNDTRYTMVQKVGQHTDGSPNFGVPLPFSKVISEPSA